jgi:glyoxylase-like metal-dependent hydrolase (beta-lactamase superfamily II)
VDPQFEVRQYVERAERLGMRIEAIISTHVHADHRSGDRELAAQTGATLYYHAAADLAFPFSGLVDGAEISLGNVVVRAVHTPGHTPESISLLVTDLTRGPEPWMVLTGDTLFAGDVGRPDLGGSEAAHVLHASLQRLLALPDYVEIYPAHIAGSPCGRGMSGKPSSTIGFERRYNPALRTVTLEAFVAHLFEGLPPKPALFEEMIARNRAG